MDIRSVDRADEQAVRAFWEVGKAASDATRPYDWTTPWEAARHFLVHGRHGSRHEMLAAHEGSETVGTAYVSMSSLDNLHLGYLAVNVRPEHWRRGIGSALLVRAEELVRAAGRRLATGEVFAPAAEDSPGLRFAVSHGYTVGIEDRMKVVDLVETEPLWPAIQEESERRRGDYRLVRWHDEVPEKHLEGFIHLNEAFNLEAPSGEMDLEAEVWDEDRVRKGEADSRKVGRRVLAVAAVTPDGEMVGLTEIVISEHTPERGFQSGTLVLPAHRGHALGLAMKVANQREVRRVFPQCRVLLTGNAGVNAAMNAVNDRLGYREVERGLEVQKEL